VRILELLAASEKPLTLTRISDELGLPKSTAHGLLRSLTTTSFLEMPEPTTYAIGLRTFEVGAAYTRRAGAVGVVAPELVALTRLLGVTSHYAVLDGPDAVYLCKEDPPGLGVQLASSVGARLPADVTAVGKVCLAWLEDATVEQHVGRAAEADPDGAWLAGLRDQLAAIRKQGHAIDDGEAAAGIRCVAAPVFDMNGPRGAIGVSYLLGASTVASTSTASTASTAGSTASDGIAAEVMAAAARVTAQLGATVRR
jgi:DNA-binding IclR family transcriptional regulator